MNTTACQSFKRDIKKIVDATVSEQVDLAILAVIEAKSIKDIPHFP